MDKLNRKRATSRAQITKYAKEIEAELRNLLPDRNSIEVKLQRCTTVNEILQGEDLKYMDGLLDTDAADDIVAAEQAAIDNYQEVYLLAKLKAERFIRARSPSIHSITSVDADNGAFKTRIKLPKIELKKFNGEIREWLGFWAQFQTIHLDEKIDVTDKFQYLVQAMVQGSRAAEVIRSYPQSKENYEKALSALKSRFGKDELLVEYYVRELLKLVITNVNHSSQMSMSRLYDQLETQLRALESLGVTSEKYAAMLYPLVESALSDDVLLAWQRNPTSHKDGTDEDPPKSRLDYLMEFLHSEVEGEERIALARAGFQSKQVDTGKRGSSKRKNYSSNDDMPTVADMYLGEVSNCIFCEKKHDSKECFKASSMSLSDKKDKVKEKKCCFLCLKSNHMSKNCRAKLRCHICTKNHVVIMCPTLHGNKMDYKSELKAEPKSDNPPPEEEGNFANHTCTSQVALQTLLVQVNGNGRTKIVRALIDSGSQRSYILKRTADDLRLKAHGEEAVRHCLFGGTIKEKKHLRYNLELQRPGGKYTCKIPVRDEEAICQNIPRLSKSTSWLFEELKRKRIWLSDVGEDCPEIELLIGADAWGKLFTGKLENLAHGLTAMETHLGWTVTGEYAAEAEKETMSLLTISMAVSSTNITNLWSLEILGIRDPPEVKTESENQAEAKALLFRGMTREADGRYSVGMPWKFDQVEIEDNKFVAIQRLKSASKKLMSSGLFHKYGDLFKDWEKEGFIKRVPENEIEKPCHYLPHRAVIKPESLTTPVRPVFDASCKSGNGRSLNDGLHTGPNLIQLIPDVLLRFREKKIGIIADIRKAFQMVGVRQEDQDFLRFLWWKDDKMSELVAYRHARVVFGATCSPFILGAVLEHHLTHVKEEYGEVAKKLLSSLYVDNCVHSEDDEESYVKFRDISTRLLASAQMDLRMWMTNIDVDIEDSSVTPVLGMKWDRKTDDLLLDVSSLHSPEKLTRRSALSLLHRIFDPMGFACPAILPMKLIIQESWKVGAKWDDELPPDAMQNFRRWSEEIPRFEEMRIPRRFGCGDRSNWSLHTFTDASKVAFAAAVFIRIEEDDEVKVQLLRAVCRITPAKPITINRLELLGCVIGARLSSSVSTALDLKIPQYFWTDSQTALAWIRRNENWGTFVGNRVKQINELTNAGDWRHVAGIHNPADLPSRGCTPAELVESNWWEGPSWLRRPEREWPSTVEEINEESIAVEKAKLVVSSAMNINTRFQFQYGWNKTIRHIAWLGRFIDWIRCKTTVAVGELTAVEVKKAERKVIQIIQSETFPGGVSDIKGLEVVNESGILRVKTKIILREDLFNFRYPVLLPRKHSLVDALIKEQHEAYCHAGSGFLITKLREKFWILKARQAVKVVIHKCVRCRRFSAKNTETDPSPLPLDRVKDAKIFEVIGIDLAGPLYLKGGDKVWMVIYTCAVYRAVHLDLVQSTSTPAFLQSLRRFVARRGRPSIIYSDNGLNFVGAQNLFRSLNWKKILKTCAMKAIEWKFSPPTGAWWGGFWERLIRTVKDLLKRMLGKSVLTYDELLTTLCEVESVVNGRPLTYVPSDSDDLVPLTPACFLHEIEETRMPDVDMAEQDKLRARYRYRRTLIHELKQRFRKEYLSQLVNRPKKKKCRPITVGEVVLVGNDQKKRLEWELARVLELYPGKRVAKIKCKGKLLLRPVRRLFQLEVQDEPELESTPTVGTEMVLPPEVKVLRSKFGRVIKPVKHT